MTSTIWSICAPRRCRAQHYITLHYITLYFIACAASMQSSALHYITSHYTSLPAPHRCRAQHSIILHCLRRVDAELSIPFHSIPFHFIACAASMQRSAVHSVPFHIPVHFMTCAASMQSGGASRMMLPCVGLASTPRLAISTQSAQASPSSE